MRNDLFSGVSCVALFALVACNGGDGGGGSSVDLASLEGVYSVESYTRNDKGCMSEGDSVLAEVSDRFMVLVVGKVLGQDVLYAYSCADEAACEEKAEALRDMVGSVYEYGFTLSEATSEGAKGEIAWAGSGEGSTCGGRVESVELTSDGESISLRAETTPSKPFDQEDGVCWTDDAQTAAEGGTCASVEVIKAKRVSKAS